MAKLHDLFTQARRAQSGGGIGFLGKNKSETKPHTAAVVIEFPTITAGRAEAALKAGADGLLFTWDGEDTATLETLKAEIASAKASNSNVVSGLRLTGNLEKLDRDRLASFKGLGIQYVILPLNAPAYLLALESKEVEKVISVPLSTGKEALASFFAPLAIRGLSALEGIAGAVLDFGLNKAPGTLTIEEASFYHGLREAVRYPAFVTVQSELNEADAYALQVLGVQAVILPASDGEEKTRKQIKALRETLEKTYQEEKDLPSPSIGR